MNEPEINELQQTRSRDGWAFWSLPIAGLLAVGACATNAWVEPAYRWILEFFSFPTHRLVEIRKPSQLVLLEIHGRIALISLTLLLLSWRLLSPQIRGLASAAWVGYVLRALVWGIGGNLPMVEADSAHHWSIANQVFQGNGPRLPYVASFIIGAYPRWGMVDDWSMPLYSYYLAGVFCLLGNSVWVAKAATLVVNLATLPLLHLVARREYGPKVAMLSVWTLAIFPPHVLYASWMLKESLVVFCVVAAAGAFLWCWSPQRRWPVLAAVGAGLVAGLMGLSRQTCLAVLAAFFMHGLLTPTPARFARLAAWWLAAAAVMAPWAWATYADYGTPFYSYSNYFKYLPSWPDHWMHRGTPTLNDYLKQGIGAIARTKIVMTILLCVYASFVFTPPLGLGLLAVLRTKPRSALARLSLWVLLLFVAGTVANIASLDQIRDFGRYYPPVLILLAPVGWQGLLAMIDRWSATEAARRSLVAVMAFMIAGFCWGCYPWTDNYRLLSDPWHIRLDRYQKIGETIRQTYPNETIVMAFHPWEVYMYSGRRTVLMPRNYILRRLREEVATYRVGVIVLDAGIPAPALQPIADEFGLDVNWEQFARDGVGAYPIRR